MPGATVLLNICKVSGAFLSQIELEFSLGGKTIYMQTRSDI